MEIDQAEEPDQSRQIMVIQSDWRQTYIDFIKEKKLPEDKVEATRVVRRSKTTFWWGINYTKEQHHQEYCLNVFRQIKERKSWTKSTQDAVEIMQPLEH